MTGPLPQRRCRQHGDGPCSAMPDTAAAAVARYAVSPRDCSHRNTSVTDGGPRRCAGCGAEVPYEFDLTTHDPRVDPRVTYAAYQRAGNFLATQRPAPSRDMSVWEDRAPWTQTPPAAPPAYRVGRHQPRNVYRGEEYIGVMFSPEDAAAVVEAMNGAAR